MRALIAQHKQFLEATVVDVLEASPERVQPPCPLFYSCGGCHLQHMSYEQQLISKTQALADSLQRIGKFNEPDIQPPIASPERLHYRIKTGLKVELQDEPLIGLYQEKSHTLINLERCLLLNEKLNEALPLLRAQYQEKPLVKATVQSIDMLLCRNPETHPGARRIKPAQNPLVFPVSAQRTLHTLCRRAHSDTVVDLSFIRTADSFCQVNASHNENLIAVVLDFLQPGPSRRILELYCGSGNFSLFLARQGASVFGIEANPVCG